MPDQQPTHSHPDDGAYDDRAMPPAPQEIGGGWELDAEAPSVRTPPEEPTASKPPKPAKEDSSWGGWGWSSDHRSIDGPTGC